MSKTTPATFCPLPWLHSYVGNQGTYQVCCIGDEFNNEIRDHDQKTISVLDGKDHLDVMNTPYMKAFRLQMLNGSLPTACTRCKLVEHLGGVSRRMQEIDANQDKITNLIQKTGIDGSISNDATHLDYRFGNTCNLQCRMCGPTASKKWIKDYRDLPPNLSRPEVMDSLEFFQKCNWQNDLKLLEEFDKKLHNTERLHFAGGEAFYVKNMERMLDICIEKDRAKHITISYNTNLTVLPESLLQKWKQFKEIRLLVSLDGFGALNDYIRYPSQFTTIDKNLKYIDQNHKEFNISEVLIATTVQANNLLHLDKIFSYLQTFSFIIPIPNLVMLLSPIYLSPRVLPKKLRLLSFLKLESLTKTLTKTTKPEHTYLLENLNTIKKDILSPLPDAEKYYRQFIQLCDFYDTKKKLNLLKVNPELKPYLVEKNDPA